MANQKITALTELTDIADGDMIPIVDDPGGTPVTKKITKANLTKNLSAAWPVGSVFIAVVSTSPATLLGFGTWSAFAAGRVLVGLDSGDTDFDAVEETGGAKTHTLLAAEMPAHSHLIPDVRDATTGGSTTQIAKTQDTSSTTGTLINTASTGGGGAHNNVQPYIVVYMWKRTA